MLTLVDDAVWANHDDALALFTLALTLHSPSPTCRCIFELFHTVVAKNQFEILLPKDEQARFIHALMKQGSSLVQDTFAHLRIENAKSYEKKDEVWIMEQVDKSVGRHEVSGHAKVNI